MFLGIGIDTGGTYTDAVACDLENDEIKASSKHITDKGDLVGSITGALEKLPNELFKDIKAVSLSTTLATNACVEGRGGRSKLILVGCDRKAVRLYGAEYGLPGHDEIIFLDGGHDQKGNLVKEPDWKYLKAEIGKYDKTVDSYALVEIWGMNNSGFEKKTKNLVQEWTGKNVVCGHELTAKINLLKRAASALLNAQLIPLITGFLDAIKKSLESKGIDAPIAIVRGDGSLMGEAFAAEHPVETILCGPAASVEGGINLTGEKNCVVVDMGGTTSDMAIVKDHIPGLAEEGAAVGKWRTGTHSIMIDTVGLGGDSRIAFDGKGNLTIGPERAAPISWAASKWPELGKHLKKTLDANRKYYFPLCEFLYMSGKPGDIESFEKSERNLLEELKNGPLDTKTLTERFGDTMLARLEKSLRKRGAVMRIGLTPTDLMHVNGDFDRWDMQAAIDGATCFANQLDMGIRNLLESVYDDLKGRIFINIAKLLIEDEDKSLISEGMNHQLKEVLLNGFRKAPDIGNGTKMAHSFMNSFKTEYSLVGIGAPIHVFLPDVARAMETRCMIPEHAAVANAAGAITANIRAEKKARVVPEYTASGISGYGVFSEKGVGNFKTYQKALDAALKAASSDAVEAAKARGAGDASVKTDVFENKAEVPIVFADGFRPEEENRDTQETDSFLVETVVTAVAVGRPAWDKGFSFKTIQQQAC